MLTPLKPTHCHSLCVFYTYLRQLYHLSTSWSSLMICLVICFSLFQVYYFSDGSWRSFFPPECLCSMAQLEVHHEGRFWGLHRGVACTSGKSLKPELCWLSYRGLWAVMGLGWVRHPMQMKSEAGHCLSAFYWELFTHNMEWRLGDCFNWNSCPLKTLLGTSHTTLSHLVQLLYILNKDMARQPFCLQQGWTKQFLSIPPYAAHFFSWYQRVALMVLWALLFEMFPERVRDYPTL